MNCNGFGGFKPDNRLEDTPECIIGVGLRGVAFKGVAFIGVDLTAVEVTLVLKALLGLQLDAAAIGGGLETEGVIGTAA